MYIKFSIFLATIACSFSLCLAKKNNASCNETRSTTQKLPSTRTPAGSFGSITVNNNASIGKNVAIGNNTSTNSLFARESAQIGTDNCSNGFLTVNGSARVTQSLNAGEQLTTQHISTNSLISHSVDTGTIVTQSTKTNCLNVLDDVTVGGTLYVNEIDPFNGTTMAFGSDLVIADPRKLIVNEISPGKKVSCGNLCNQFEADPDGTICFSGKYVSLGEDTILLANEINPAGPGCRVDDTLTTTFSGNVHFNKKVTFQEPILSDTITIDTISATGTIFTNTILPLTGSTICFGSDTKLLINEINPASAGCTEDDTLTTTFSGNVYMSHNLSFPATSAGPTNGVIIVNDSNFIHSYGTSNTFLGSNAGNLSMFGASNVGVGSNAFESNINGDLTVALGSQALQKNQIGSENAAVGGLALQNNVDGSRNVAVGAFSMRQNVSGINNTAVGHTSLRNALGSQNTAVGQSSLSFHTTGDSNTAVGWSSLRLNTLGTENTGCGGSSLGQSQGSYNSALGFQSLFNTTGDRNIGIGHNGGYNITSGNFNIAIGNLGVIAESNAIRIGNSTDHNTCYIAGIRGKTTGVNDAVAVLIDSNGQLGTISSSQRYKKDIKDMDEASNQLKKLRPVTFRFKNNAEDTPLEYGLIAEEVAQVFPELVVYNNDGEPETVKYHILPTLLLNEYQQQQKTIDQHSEKIDELFNQLENFALSDTQLDALIEKIIKRGKVKETFERLNQLEKAITQNKKTN